MTDQNPLIAKQTEKTLNNIVAVLTFLQEYHENAEFNYDDKAANAGFFLTLQCVNQALCYEISNISQEVNMPTAEKDSIFLA